MKKETPLLAWEKLQRATRPVAEMAAGAAGALVPVVERLEDRWLMAGNPAAVQTVPFTLAFDGNGGGLADANGASTGFTWVQPNVNGNEYQPSLLNDNTSAGTLSITTTGSATNGSNWEGDNTQVDVMQSQFNGATGSFTISTRLIGPLGNLANPNEQGGLILGPDDDDYVKFVAVSTSSGQELQFVDEQKTSSGYLHAINPNNSYTSIGSFSNVNTLDLEIAANADTGTITGYYRVNGGTLTQVGQSVTLSGAEKTAFFNSTTRAGIMALAKNNLAPVTVTFQNFSVVSGTPAPALPTVVSASPGAGQTNVSRDAFVSCNLSLPYVGEGVDPSTLNHTTCYLVRTADGKLVSASLNTDGAGGTIILQPNSPLDANTNYTFYVNSGVKDTGGHSFVPFTTSFTTGTGIVATNPAIAFQKVALSTATGQVYTGVTMGPDGMLYACTYTGLIQRFAINADGTLGTPQNITTVQTNNGGQQRTITGIAFDPSSTANNLILWINNSYYAPDIAGNTNAPNFSSKISVLSGADLQNYQDVITGLPRSVRDHMTEQLSFGPDGALYWSQPSNSSMGAPDSQWGLPPKLCSRATILRLDTKAALAAVSNNGGNAINVVTPDGGGTYNPFATGALLTIYATGVRNAYSLVWANNGKLYAPVNGASYGGATPSSPNATAVEAPYTANPATVQGIADVTEVENDFLDQIQSGAYYGHPDPVRGQYVLDAGNPTTLPASESNSQVFTQYPAGTNADPGYQAPIYNFGNHYSPDGMIQYEGNAFGGALNNALLVTRYSGGKDIEIMYLNSSGGIASVQTGTAGLSGFVNPLGIAEDNATGNLYVADYGAQTLTLERPIPLGAKAAANTNAMYFKDAPGGSASASQTLTLTNNGTQTLAIPADGLVIAGGDATQFLLVNDPPVPTTIAPGASLAIQISYMAPSGNAAGIHMATVQIKTNDPDNALIAVNLYGLTTTASVTTLPAPTGISATQGDGGVTLKWAAETAGNLGGYNVYRSTSASGPFTKLNTAGVLPAADVSFSDTTAPSSGTVYYRVTAVDTSNNESQPGSASLDLSGQISTPAGLTATGSSSGVTLTWSAQAAAAGFNVYRSTSPVNGFTLLNTGGLVTSASYSDSTATGGVIYYYRVAAVDGQGHSSGSALTNAPGGPGAPAAPPAAPTGVTAAPTVGGIALSWTAETGVAGFNVYAGSSANGTFKLLNTSGPLSASATGYTDTTAPAGATTYYEVTAVDSSGGESNGAAASAALPAAPAAPTGLTAKGSSAGVALNWKAVTNAAGYNVYRASSANGTFTLLNGGLVTTTSFTDANAPVGVTSYYRVTAVSNLGTESAPATASAAVPAPIPAPVAPTGFSATGILGGGVTLKWNANTESDLAGYNVYRSAAAAGTFTLLNTGGLLTATSYADSTASAGATWYYQVIAVDTQGRTSPAATASAAVATAAPAAPTGLQAAVYPTAITLSWAANTESDLAGYQVFRANSANGPFAQISPGAVQTATYLIDTGAAIGTPSYYKVVAVNVYGHVSPAATINATRPATAPAAPAGLAAVASVKSVTLSWNANGETNFAGYQIFRAASANGPYQQLNGGVQTGASFVDTTAPAGVVSYYQVVAVNQFGMVSAPAAISAKRLAANTPPATPVGFAASASTAGISLTWDAATGSAADDVAGYYVYRCYSAHGHYNKLDAKPLPAGTLSYMDKTATAKVKVYYELVAVSPTGVLSAPAWLGTSRPAAPKVGKAVRRK